MGVIDQLPHTLTTGVVATREGLVIDAEADTPVIHALLLQGLSSQFAWYVMPWPDAAERLRFVVGAPGLGLRDDDYDSLTFEMMKPNIRYYRSDEIGRLHRLAAILCDDAEAFRVLHWCVHNLTDQNQEV